MRIQVRNAEPSGRGSHTPQWWHVCDACCDLGATNSARSTSCSSEALATGANSCALKCSKSSAFRADAGAGVTTATSRCLRALYDNSECLRCCLRSCVRVNDAEIIATPINNKSKRRRCRHPRSLSQNGLSHSVIISPTGILDVPGAPVSPHNH